MTDPLYTSNEDPVELDGSVDANGALQILHGSDSLADYNQRLYAEHEDLEQSTGIIRIKIADFAQGGHNWTITAEHDDSGTVSWTRATGHSYYDFGPMTSELQVDVTATSDETTPQILQQTVWIKTTPIDATPDRPRG